jgi:hypothetical protein
MLSWAKTTEGVEIPSTKSFPEAWLYSGIRTGLRDSPGAAGHSTVECNVSGRDCIIRLTTDRRMFPCIRFPSRLAELST